MSHIDDLLILLKEDPLDAFTNYALALELEKSGRIKEAVGYLEKLVVNSPGYLATYYQLGRMLIALNETEKAEDVLKAGAKVAQEQNNRHTLAEINMLLFNTEE